MPKRSLLLGLVVLTAAGAACSGGSAGGDKAGGHAGRQVTLEMANPASGDLNMVPPVADFVRRVAALSHGSIQVKVIDQWGDYTPNSEERVVRSVAAGRLDLAWAGSRVFDSLGLSSLRALSAPMLIDSYPLEEAVLSSAIPRQMLGALKRVGVTGLAILGDGLRLPIGVRRPLVAPDDWRGHSFGTFRSQTQEQAIRALGATPIVAIGAYRQHAIDTGAIQGFELDLRRYRMLRLEAAAPYIAANVPLWPEFDVLIANPRRLASLTDQQRAWLEHAAADAARDSVGLTSRSTPGSIRAACALGARFATASPAQLRALRRSFAGVYARLARDAQTSAFIRQIETLARAARQPFSPHVPGGCRATS
jgi:TRAP-type C4-dicarboxylate transport system substrate-binding protein